ncbi:asparagine synthase-domain-containing protein [Mucor mucedo]|uniref:asparagine synthase-domain-containing protein n=1 Tax=Mucor mucedo TaxID=29922 RepID=UPI00221E6513|nr:asparagine synthase-domain-containing protein [Mucor mucedo]KAI7892225.1 asparagine synthase-domain-containing protein [Mucor mucedo]
MCGILFSLSNKDRPVNEEEWEILKELNTRRGPDAQNLKQVHCSCDQEELTLQFFSTVLHLRGPEVVPQPRFNPATGDVLCWNGEIFGGVQVGFGQNDTEVLMAQLEKAESEVELLSLFSTIEGPFAFVFYKAATNKVWFARDCLGRRSLLWQKSETHAFMLSSVAKADQEWEEVPAHGIYCIDLQSTGSELVACNKSIKLYPWTYHDPQDRLETLQNGNLTFPFPRLNETIPSNLASIENEDEDPEIDESMNTAIKEFTSELNKSVKNRVADVPYLDSKGQARVAILFSGGLDCICLAALADQHLPLTESIDLLNVAFENPRIEKAKSQKVKAKKNKKNKQLEEEIKPVIEEPAVRSIYDTPDRLTGRAGVEELRRISPERTWNFVEINVPYPEAMEYKQRIIDRMYPLDTVMDLSIAMAFWFASRGKGVIHGSEEYESHARVLISGLGADEQLGGYSRHREAFRQGSWEKLIQEMWTEYPIETWGGMIVSCQIMEKK